MQGHVLIAKAKPLLAAEAAKGFNELPGLASATPAEFLVVLFSQSVGEAVYIWANVQTKMSEIIANIHREHDLLWT
jgi:hypothetical protein